MNWPPDLLSVRGQHATQMMRPRLTLFNGDKCQPPGVPTGCLIDSEMAMKMQCSSVSVTFFLHFGILPGLVLCQDPQYTYGSIASCADFDCNPGIYNCTFGSKNYSVAGMVPFQAPVLPENLTWSLAQFTSDARASEYQVSHKDFYIGTPPTLDLSTATYDGCAAFFVDSNATYPIGEPSAHPTGIPPPPCDSVIGSECIAAMESDITEFVRASDIQSVDDLCNGMRDAVHRGNARQACSRVALGGTDWGRIAFRGMF